MLKICDDTLLPVLYRKKRLTVHLKPLHVWGGVKSEKKRREMEIVKLNGSHMNRTLTGLK